MNEATVRLRAKGRYLHNGRKLFVDEEYDCDAMEALDLIAMGRAVRVETPASAAAEEAKVKRVYKRRDLEVEE